MTAFEFGDPPPVQTFNNLPKTTAPNRLLVEFAQALRDNPKQWAKYPRPLAKSGVGAAAWGINHQGKGACLALRTGEFEAVTRGYVLYVRFVGGEA